MSEQEPEAAGPVPPAVVPPAPVRRDRSRLRATAVLLALFLVVGTGLSLAGNDDQGGGGNPEAAFIGCDPVVTTPTSLNRNHVLLPSELDYSAGPPAFGPHLTSTAGFERAFYTAQDRPDVGRLVHSLEHGFTIAWYDDTAAADDAAMKTLRELADQFRLANLPFIAAPWHPSDGAAMPADRHYALTRWSADPDDPANQLLQRGNWQYCGTVAPEDFAAFLERWPNEQSPEPGIGVPETTAV
jgi:hypothetical protein